MKTINAKKAAWAAVAVCFGMLCAFERAEAAKQEDAGAGAALRTETIAARHGIAAEKIIELRAEGYGWGEIEGALVIAQNADVALEEVFALRERGLGWGEIAKKYKVNLGQAPSTGEKAGQGEWDTDDLRDAPRGEKPRTESEIRAARIAAERGIDAATVLRLRREGFGWGEVDAALRIAEASGAPIEEVTALRLAGIGWGEIGAHYGVSLEEMKRAEEAEAGEKPLPEDMRQPRERELMPPMLRRLNEAR